MDKFLLFTFLAFSFGAVTSCLNDKGQRSEFAKQYEDTNRIQKSISNLFEKENAIADSAIAEAGLTFQVSSFDKIEDPRFNSLAALAFDSKGALFTLDSELSQVFKIEQSVVQQFSGSAIGLKNGVIAEAQFNRPRALAIDFENNLFIADTLNKKIRKITEQGLVSSYSGNYDNDVCNSEITSGVGFVSSLAAFESEQYYSSYSAETKQSYISLANRSLSYRMPCIIKFDGEITALAVNSKGQVYFAAISASDNQAAIYNLKRDENLFDQTSFNQEQGHVANLLQEPVALAFDQNDELYILDAGLMAVLKFNKNGLHQIVIDGSSMLTPKIGAFINPQGLAFDKSNNLYIADQNRIIVANSL